MKTAPRLNGIQMVNPATPNVLFRPHSPAQKAFCTHGISSPSCLEDTCSTFRHSQQLCEDSARFLLGPVSPPSLPPLVRDQRAVRTHTCFGPVLGLLWPCVGCVLALIRPHIGPCFGPEWCRFGPCFGTIDSFRERSLSIDYHLRLGPEWFWPCFGPS